MDIRYLMWELIEEIKRHPVLYDKVAMKTISEGLDDINEYCGTSVTQSTHIEVGVPQLIERLQEMRK